MTRQGENQRQTHVLLVGTAEESGTLVSLLGRSDDSSHIAGDFVGLGSVLSIETHRSNPTFSQANPGLSAASPSTRVAYVDKDSNVSDEPHHLETGSGTFIPMTPSGDIVRGTVFLRGQNGGAPIDELLLVRRDLPVDKVLRICLSLVRKGCVVLAASPALQIIKKNHGAPNLNGRPLVRFRPTRLESWRLGVKRVIDIVGAVIGTLVLLPIFLIAAVLIKLTSPGPVFFKQIRVGKEGKEFTFYKLRSMMSGDDSKYREYLRAFVEDGREAGVDNKGHKVYKIMDDPRITSFGHFLRRTSLDEFPQIINVLKGHMSLVGPRPCLPYEWELYTDWEKARLSVTPGLTGLWQVTGRSNVTFHDMVLLDLYYISNWSFLWDLKLILQTIPVILLGKGAH
jgi:exopolysaccharide biosynthesis polyprenyl glycosylphosphotransferase